jgi:ribosome-associated protein
MSIDITKEIQFKTARSGGKGGQNVNKVETMVEGRWLVNESQLVNEQQKNIIHQQLSNRITSDGFLLVKSQTHRTQQENKEEVINKINALVNKALQPKKARIATKISKAVKEKRLENKKQKSFLKESRKKFKQGDY